MYNRLCLGKASKGSVNAHIKCLTGEKKSHSMVSAYANIHPIHSSTGMNCTIPWLWTISTARGINLSPVLPAHLKSREDYTKVVRRKIVCSVWITSVSVGNHVFLQVATQKHILCCWCSKSSFYCCWQAITSQQNNAFIGIFCKVCISWEVLTYYSKSDRSMFRRWSSCLQTFRIETWPETLLVPLGGGSRGFCSLAFF